jgi:hypothetical protein
VAVSEELRRHLERMIDIDVRSGLYDEGAIIEAVSELIAGEQGPDGAEMGDALAPFRALVSAALAQAAAGERDFPPRTDNDRLDDAFADLSARDIVTGQAVGLTVQEGAALMDQAVVEMTGGDVGRLPRGSVYYHRQDLERALEGGGLSLAFTSYAEHEGATADIGREVVHVLAHHGLSTRWDGTREQRIVVTPMRWQRRRATTAPPGAGPAPAMAASPPHRAPVVCPRCGGRGWIQKDAGSFPDVCGCKR